MKLNYKTEIFRFVYKKLIGSGQFRRSKDRMGCKISNTNPNSVSPFGEDGPAKKDRADKSKKDQETTVGTDTSLGRSNISSNINKHFFVYAFRRGH